MFFSKSSLLPGNIYTYLTLKTEIIDRTTRYSLFSIFSIIIVISLVLFIFLICRSCMEQRQNDKIKKTSLTNVIQTLKISGQLLKTRNMLLLLILFAYLGKYYFKYVLSFKKQLYSRFITWIFCGNL